MSIEAARKKLFGIDSVVGISDFEVSRVTLPGMS